MSIKTYVRSGSQLPGSKGPVDVMEIGNPGQPTEIIIHNGKLTVYDTNGQTIIQNGVIQTNAIAVGSRSFVHNITFTPTDRNTVYWSAGTIYFGNGTSYEIIAGNTGNLSETSYIYFDETDTLKIAESASTLTDEMLLMATVEIGFNTYDKAKVTVTRLPGGTISADQINGGTLNLGGSSDGNGVLSLKDSTNIERVRLDKDGITITDGKLTIQDENSAVIMDAQGIVGANVFASGTANGSGEIICGSAPGHITSDTNISDCSVTFTLARQTPVMLFYRSYAKTNYGTDSPYYINCYIKHNSDGTYDAPWLNTSPATTSPIWVSTSFYDLLDAGTHTFQMKVSSTGSGLVYGTNCNITYLVLGT